MRNVIGARVAGSSTAMLLARKGLDVLVLDRASFPSDTLSTHQVQVPGVARLHRWGLLDKVIASGAPPARAVRFDVGFAVLRGHFPPFQGVDAVYSPRRTVLDALLAAAVEAGLGGGRPLEAAMAGYQRQRDAAAIPVYDFTTGLASFAPPPPEAVRLFQALERQPAEVDRFLGAITGSIPLGRYFAPANLLRVLGPRAMAGIMLGKLFSGRSRAAAASS
jgi:glycine/D-amino acid oxidase-like deaminating enzyme